MKTITKTLAALVGLVLATGYAVAADPTPQTPYGPGWRHQQMAQAWEDGTMPAFGMMRGHPGFGPGFAGHAAMARQADGTFDAKALPPWCPYTETTQPQDSK